VAASSRRGVLPVIATRMRARRMRARTSSEPRGVECACRRLVAAGSVFVFEQRTRARGCASAAARGTSGRARGRRFRAASRC
jgi:hypothetical protein